MDTKIKILIFCFLSAFGLQAQSPYLTFAAKFQITSATGGDPYNIVGIVSDDLSRWTGSDVQINDSIYVIDGSDVYVLAVTSITSVVGPTVTLVANDPLDAGVSIPTGQAAILRPTNNYTLPTYISGLRDDLRSMMMNRQAQLIDDITGGGLSITDFISAGVAVPPSAPANLNDGETWRNMTTGELWASDGNKWYPFNYGPKECVDTVTVSLITVQSGGSVTTGSPLVRNTSGVWEHLYNHATSNLIPDGVVTDVIVGPRAIIQYCGVRKGSGATPNTSYYVDQTANTGFTTTKPTTNIRPLGKVASNGDFLVNAGLLFSRDMGIKLDSVYYVSPTSSYCKENFVQEYERKDSNLLVLVLGDSKTEEPYRGPQQLSRKLILSRGTPYGGPGFGSFASTPAQGNWFALSGVTIISGGVAEKSLNNKGLRLNTVGSYYEIFTSDPPWGNWKKMTYTIQQEAAASSLTVTLDGVPSTVNIPSGSGLSTFSITAAANTTHTIRFTQLSGTTVLLNYYLTSDIPNSTSVWNIGNSGSGASRWTNDILDNDWDILKPYDPDMIIIRLGINDAFGGLGATQFNTDMKSLLEKIKLKFPLTNITLVGTEQSLLGPSTYIEYNNVMATLSQDSCYSFVDMDKVWPDWAKATSIGLTSDDIHENTAGGEFVGKAYFEALMGRSDISVSSSSINYWKEVGSNVVRETGNVGVGLLNAVEKVDIFGTDSSYIKLNTGVSGSFASPVYNGIKFFGGNPNFQLGRIEAVNEISNKASGDIRFVLRNSLGTYTEAGRFSGLTGGLSLNTSALEALFEGKGKGNTTSTRAISIRNSDNNSLISVLDATGKAGVGILNPDYNWDIYGTNPILALRSNVFADNKKINFQTGSAVEGYIGLSSTTLTFSSGRGAAWGSNMVFETDASTRMSISSTGAVTVNSLAGTGNRIVQANSTGIFQPTTLDPATVIAGLLPSGTNGQLLSHNGTTWIGASPISGTVNYVPKFGTTTSITNSQIFDNGTNVGVGTVLPAAKMHLYTSAAGVGSNGLFVQQDDATAGISHTSKFTTEQQGGGAGRTLFFAASPNTGTSNGQFDVLTENGGAYIMALGPQISGGTNALSLYNNAGTVEATRFSSSGASWLNGGNFGIGTTGASEALHVVGNIRFSGALMPNNTAGTSGQVLTSAGAGTVPTWTTNTSESTSIGAFNNTGNSNGLSLSGSALSLHAATISTPGVVNTGQQTFTSGAGSKYFNGTGTAQISVDGNTDATEAGINFTQLGGTDIIAQMQVNSSDANNGRFQLLLEDGGSYLPKILIGSLEDQKGVQEFGGLYEDVTAVTSSPYTVLYGDRNIYLDGTTITVNLQAIGTSTGETKIGRVIYFFNDNATNVTITPNGSETIADAASLTLLPNTGVTLLAVTGTQWAIRD